MSSFRDVFLLSLQNKAWKMFLLVSGCHVSAHLDGHQHCISMQSSIYLGESFLWISCIWKIKLHWPESRQGSEDILSPFISQILNSLLNSSDFYFWWCDSENQQLFNNSNELSRMSGHPWSMKKVSITRAGRIWNAKIQSLFGSWEKQGFVKVAIRRAVCFWEYPLGELSL